MQESQVDVENTVSATSSARLLQHFCFIGFRCWAEIRSIRQAHAFFVGGTVAKRNQIVALKRGGSEIGFRGHVDYISILRDRKTGISSSCQSFIRRMRMVIIKAVTHLTLEQ